MFIFKKYSVQACTLLCEGVLSTSDWESTLVQA